MMQCGGQSGYTNMIGDLTGENVSSNVSMIPTVISLWMLIPIVFMEDFHTLALN